MHRTGKGSVWGWVAHGLDGWPGERWLKLSSDNVRSIMKKRVEMSAQKGCDGIDVDNVDGYVSATPCVSLCQRSSPFGCLSHHVDSSSPHVECRSSLVFAGASPLHPHQGIASPGPLQNLKYLMVCLLYQTLNSNSRRTHDSIEELR